MFSIWTVSWNQSFNFYLIANFTHILIWLFIFVLLREREEKKEEETHIHNAYRIYISSQLDRDYNWKNTTDNKQSIWYIITFENGRE